MAQVFATYPGIERVLSCTYTRTLGMFPNVASMRIVPQVNLPAANGTLTLGHGGETVSFPFCRVDQASMDVSTRGHIERIRIFDRRVWWQYAFIDGVYNVRQSDDSILESTKKSARELGSILFTQLGEAAHVVNQLPDNDYPFYHWECHSVSEALTDLCDRYGCDVDLDWVTNIPIIVRRGFGNPLPNNFDVVSVSVGADVAEIPARIAVCCGYDLYESKLKLKAVGMDTDGEIKDIDDLSYAPAAGWEASVTNPGDPLSEEEDEELRQLARKSVYRMWKLESQADGSLEPGGYEGPEITDINQLLPLKSTTVENYSDPDSEELVNQGEAFLSGVFQLGGAPEVLENSDACDQLEGEPFRIHGETGIVYTTNPIVKLNDAKDGFQPAELYLTTSYNISDPDNTQYQRYTVIRTVSTNRGTHAEHRQDFVRTIRSVYGDESCTTVTDTETNEEELTTEVNQRIDEIFLQFQTVSSAQVVYRSIKPVQHDGARRQVRWSVSTNVGAFTVATYNSEADFGALRRINRSRNLRVDNILRSTIAEQLRRRQTLRRGLL